MTLIATKRPAELEEVLIALKQETLQILKKINNTDYMSGRFIFDVWMFYLDLMKGYVEDYVLYEHHLMLQCVIQ